MVRSRFLPLSRSIDEGGFTLVEALVTSLIILLVAFSIISLYLLAIKGRQWGESVSGAEAKARLAMEWILRDAREAIDIVLPEEGGSSLFLYQPLKDQNGKIILPVVMDPQPVQYYLSGENLVREKGTETRTIARGITSLSFSTQGSSDNLFVEVKAKEGDKVCVLNGRAWARN